MPNRADQLIELLGLQPHPEGGHYSEVFRSALAVEPPDGRGRRPAVTTIYFLLRAGEHSALHRVLSDEIWHFYEGEPNFRELEPAEPVAASGGRLERSCVRKVGCR